MRLHFPRLLVLLVFAASTLLCRGAFASLFEASGGNDEIDGSSFIPRGSYDLTSPVSAGDSRVFNNTGGGGLTYSMIGSSSASQSGLHAAATVHATKTSATGDNFLFTLRSAGHATAIFTDMIISGPAGNVSTSANMFLHGTHSAFTSAGVQGAPECDETMSVGFIVNNGSQVGANAGGQSNNGSAEAYATNGVLSNWTSPGVFMSPGFTVPANTPFTLQIDLDTRINVADYLGDPFTMDGVCDFSNTLQFNPDGPVFNLPAGYTANSVDAGISNNVVPEPASLAPLIFALLTLRRRVAFR